MSEEKIQFYHQDTIQIRFNDIDGLGHVNNTTLQEYFDIGRSGYFNKVFDNKIDWNTFGTIVASIKTDFIAPAFISDKLLVKTKITSIGNKSLQMLQQIEDIKGTPKAVCQSVMVGFNPQTNKSIVIPEQWRNLIGITEKW